jgi:hypothetical protein
MNNTNDKWQLVNEKNEIKRKILPSDSKKVEEIG